MATNKTVYTGQNPVDFIESFADTEQKKADSFELMKLMAKWSGHEPKMWGPTIVGFGNYSYKYASGHQGSAPIIGFAPRKAAFSLYVYSPTDESKALLETMGKFTMGKACIYAKKLSDLHIPTLEKLSKEAFKYVGKHHQIVV